MLKKENGITLIALVITIIVLLILAGVSISLVLGNNGVLTEASSAVAATRKSTAKEEIEMAIASCESDYYTAWAGNSSVNKSDYITAANLERYIKAAAGNKLKTIVITDSSDSNKLFTITYTTKENDVLTFYIDKDKKVYSADDSSSSLNNNEEPVTLISQDTANVLQLVDSNAASYALLNAMKSFTGANDDVFDALELDGIQTPIISYPSETGAYRENLNFIDQSYVLKLNDNNSPASNSVTIVVPKNSSMQSYTDASELKILFASNYSKDSINGTINDSAILLDVTEINSDSIEFELPADIIGNKDVEGVFTVLEYMED